MRCGIELRFPIENGRFHKATAQQDGRIVTSHTLGGCQRSASFRTGVVNVPQIAVTHADCDRSEIVAIAPSSEAAIQLNVNFKGFSVGSHWPEFCCGGHVR
jgi:hypothetical protein